MSTSPSKWLIPLLGLLVAFGPISIDTYLPSLPTIANDLNSSQQTIQHTISAFLIGMTIGMLLFGPLSDLLGRKPLLLLGASAYALSSIGCAMAQSGESLVVLRLLQSLGASAVAVLGRTLVRDLFEMKRAASILSTMHIISMSVMLLAPLVGAYIVKNLDWRWIFYLLSLIAALALAGILLIIKEPNRERPAAFSLRSYFESYKMALRVPVVSFFILTNGFIFSGMFVYITASAFVYIDYFGYSETTYSFLFSANIACIILMTFINSHLVKTHSTDHALSFAARIALLATLLLWLIGATFAQIPWLFMLTSMLYISVTGAIGANSLAMLFNLIPERAGTAAGLLVAMQFAMGALGSYLTTWIFDGSAQSLLYAMAGCGTLCLFSYLGARYFAEHPVERV